jgi:hypothetical protein
MVVPRPAAGFTQRQAGFRRIFSGSLDSPQFKGDDPALLLKTVPPSRGNQTRRGNSI